MLGLNASAVWRGDEEAKEIGDRMVDATWDLTLPDGSWRQDNLDALRKTADAQIGPPSAVTGRLVGPLLTFARVAGNLRAGARVPSGHPRRRNRIQPRREPHRAGRPTCALDNLIQAALLLAGAGPPPCTARRRHASWPFVALPGRRGVADPSGL